MLIESGLPNQMHRGKVRDTYAIDDNLLLMVATDRISAFDVVLPTGIPEKGKVLNRISAFWFDRTAHLIPNHLVALADAGNAGDYLKANPDLAGVSPELASQAMIVKKAERIDIECIVRGYITGSAWGEYRRQGTVSGKPHARGPGGGHDLPRTAVHRRPRRRKATTRICRTRKWRTW